MNLVPFDMAQVTSAANRSRCEPGSPAPESARESRPHVAYALRTNLRTNQTGSNGANVSQDASPCLGSGDQPPAICPPLRLSLATGAANGESGGEVLFPQARGVRRLMPVECERLQGFPDGWTDIPGASDSQRYKALGNAVAVVVIEWIGRRLASSTDGRA